MKELRHRIATTSTSQQPARPRLVRAHEAWCLRRPSSDEVRKLLEPLGFRLTFFLSASRYESLPQANLPAQYHFEDGRGTQVLYLAGRDASDDGSALPPHASRCEARRRYAMSYQRAYKRTLAERARHLF